MSISKFSKMIIAVCLIVLGTGLAHKALAGGNARCDHPVFVEKACAGDYIIPGPQGPQGETGERGERGAPGPAGNDGVDGLDGRDGARGADGAPGRDGVDGKDGRDGIDGKDADMSVVNNLRSEVRDWDSEMREHIAATTAVQIHLPQEKSFRATLNTSRVGGEQAFGLGLAWKNEDGAALTFGIGKAVGGGDTVVQGGLSVEF